MLEISFKLANFVDVRLTIPIMLLSLQEVIVPDNAEECVLTDYDPATHSRYNGRGNEIYDSDGEDGPGGPQRVQCANQ